MAEELGLNWQLGDRWTIETQTIQSPASFRNKDGGTVEWNFQVAGNEKVSGKDCFRVEITCADSSRPQPNVTIWVDRDSGMLMRLTSRIPVDGKYTEYTESYSMADGVPTPVMGIIPSLPLDLPIFSRTLRNSKSLEPQVYESVAGTGQGKDINEMRFAYAVTQTVSALSTNQMKSLSNDDSDSQGVAVQIEAGNRKVEQVWKEGRPWPIYSTNGVSVSRLKGFTPAEKEVKP
ncbi:MAG: hypothetical protein Q4D98_13445 [Planctomycetia bacterium]|nr:hypothetical protein [Planctomycetia bacterium]